ncbi:MAG: alpha/beta hydrolase-fold protein [Verrucomicrobiota bacterium]|nr:alpha/beta hydrolase-fold protein [Verrucomicrobiota bacterium]
MIIFRTIEVSDGRFEHEGLRCVTVKSPSLRMRADVTLYVPRAAESITDVPVVLLLHGVYGSHWSWTLQGGAHRTVAHLLGRGEIPPMVLAMPSDGLWGDGSGYVRHGKADFERWIVEEVPSIAMKVVRAVTPRSRWAIAGLSMGGFGALRIGAKYGGRFRAISAHSSMTQFEQLAQFVEEDLSSYHCPNSDRSVLETMMTHRHTLPPLRFDCGAEDPLLSANRELHAQLDSHGIAHTYEEFSGGHEWPYWEEHLANTLRFFGQAVQH